MEGQMDPPFPLKIGKGMVIDHDLLERYERRRTQTITERD
jgi:hypothetical protein